MDTKTEKKHLSSSGMSTVDENDASYGSPNRQKASARWVTVEPVIMFVAMAIGIFLVIQPQYLRERVADMRNVTLPPPGRGGGGGNESESNCNFRNKSNPYYIALQEIQAEVSFWTMIITISGSLPALIMSPLIGSWGDRVGRKVTLGLPVFGYLVTSVFYLIIFYFKLPLWVFSICVLFQGVTGGPGLIIAASVSYVTDITSEKNRVHRIGIVHGSFVIGIGLTQLAVGFIIQEVGYGPALWLPLCSIFLSFLYVVLPPFLIETVDTTRRQSDSDGKTNKYESIQSLLNLFKINTGYRRIRLALIFTMELTNELLNTSAVGIVIIYGLGPPFCWSSVLVSGYWTMLLFLSAFCMIVATRVLSIWLSDCGVLQVSNIFAIYNGFLTAFAKNTLGIYLAAALGSLRGMSIPMVPLILSKVVTKQEHGVVFAFEASVLNLGTLISPILLNNVYTYTVQTQPNAVFILLGAASIIPLLLTAVLQLLTAHVEKTAKEQSTISGVENKGSDQTVHEKATQFVTSL